MARPGYHSHLPPGPGSGSVQIETIAGYARCPECQNARFSFSLLINVLLISFVNSALVVFLCAQALRSSLSRDGYVGLSGVCAMRW